MPPSTPPAAKKTPGRKKLAPSALKNQLNWQRPQWNYLIRACNNQIGPVKKKVPPLPKNLVVAKNLAQQSTFSTPIPFGIEYVQDGTKTSTLISGALWKRLCAWLDPKTNPRTEAQVTEALADLKLNLDLVLNLTEQFFPTAMSAPFQSLVARARWSPSTLETWLRAQSLQFGSVLPFTNSSRPQPDQQLPFIVYKRDQAEPYTFAETKVYWQARGLENVYWDNVFTPLIRRNTIGSDEPIQWDKNRLQFTLYQPYVLFCRGILRGKQWQRALARVLKTRSGDSKQTPFVLILSDGVQAVPAADEPTDFSFAVVSAGNSNSASYRQMAAVFGAQVVDLKALEQSKKWSDLGAGVGVAPIVLLDRQRTVLVPPSPINGAGTPEFGRDWFASQVHALTLRRDDPMTPADAEIILRARIEADSQGVVAGGGAAICRLVSKLDNVAEPLHSWLKEAFEAPTRQILQNAQVSDADIETIMQKIYTDPDVMFSFLIDKNNVWTHGILRNVTASSQYTVIPGTPPIVLGNALELGVVTPVPEVQRIIRRAIRTAWQYALVDYLARQGVGKPEEPSPYA